jgi:GH35 family endo-1,4-beta-xylanase
MIMNIKDMKFGEIERFCLEQFDANNDLFKTVVKDNIERNRKGKKTIVIKDKTGAVQSGIRVKAVLKNHEFKHGAHIFMLDQFETASENERYRNLFSQYFNLATIPFYWAGLEPVQGKVRFSADSENVWRRPSTDLCLNYCREKGIDAKIHCLFYDKFIPDWLPKDNEAEMKKLYEKRFMEIAQRYGNGVMYDIEVINELLETHWWTTNSVISDTRNSLEWSFELAQKYFPNDVLVINDGNFVPEIGEKTYRHPYYMLIDAALAKGVRIDKIGIQNHIYMGMRDGEDIRNFKEYFDPIKILKGLDVMSEFGKPLEITEVQIPTFGEGNEAEDLQAEVLKYLYTLWFSSEKLESVIYWNSVDQTAYSSPDWDENRLRAGLFHRDLAPKKSGEMLKKLFKEQWHTEVELVTDENGQIEFEGFHGEYEVCIQSRDGEVYNAELNKDNQKAEFICII